MHTNETLVVISGFFALVSHGQSQKNTSPVPTP
jgi:hypothetical protein